MLALKRFDLFDGPRVMPAGVFHARQFHADGRVGFDDALLDAELTEGAQRLEPIARGVRLHCGQHRQEEFRRHRRNRRIGVGTRVFFGHHI